jgi:transcriptional regulatory protein RtcR
MTPPVPLGFSFRDGMKVCRESRTLAEAGRKLYGVSRAQSSVINDSDRLKKYLARFGLSWNAIVPAGA